MTNNDSHSILDTLKKTLLILPHPAGYPFIIGGVVATLMLIFISKFFAIVALIFSFFCLYFFRDPRRVTPQNDSLILSPADGLVSAIVPDSDLPAEIADTSAAKYTRVSVFLSVLDVHVNRIPVAGKIVRINYKPGKFFNADLDKASEENERCSALIETAGGLTVGVVQIAGLIARRILNDLQENQAVISGTRFGIIRFGSRVDLYLPQGLSPLVCVGQRAIGGETIIADSAGKQITLDGLST